ncbi:hypothetical protein IAU60_002928 [Kwoniella sp. DSM 27419]
MVWLPIVRTLVLVNLLATGVGALSSFEYLQKTKDFADAFLPGNSADLVNALQAKKSLFAEDVIGNVDIAGRDSITGRVNSTEYRTKLFGLFLGAAQNPTVPSPIGLPVSYNVTAAVVEHNTVSAGIKFELSYPLLNLTFPIELDAFLTINDNGEISQYDLIFRRWAWAIDTIMPLLTPHMAQLLGMNNDNATLTLHQFLAFASCQQTMLFCNNEQVQYANISQCLATMAEIPTGQFYRIGENNLACRAVHAPMLQLNPAAYCSAFGATGSGICTDRDYLETMSKDFFSQGFLAPKFVTPQNQAMVKNIWASSENQKLDPLLEITMSQQDYHSWDPTFYATCTFVYFIFYYFCCKVIDILFYRTNKIYKGLSRELQKNVTMYVLTIIFTAIALALQLVGVLGFKNEWDVYEIRCVRLAGTLVAALYIYELVFRFNMRLPLVAHHILTIFAISLGVTTVEMTQNPRYMLSCVLWLFQATTEQPTFVGLMGYRLGWNKRIVAQILKISSIQTFVFKAASAIAILVYWGVHQRRQFGPIDTVWTVFVWIISIGLLLTQIWGSYVTYIIGVRIEKKKRPAGPVRLESDMSAMSGGSEFQEKGAGSPAVELQGFGLGGGITPSPSEATLLQSTLSLNRNVFGSRQVSETDLWSLPREHV